MAIPFKNIKSSHLVANSATEYDNAHLNWKTLHLLTNWKSPLQKLQIGELLMQNLIINGLFVVVAWHY